MCADLQKICVACNYHIIAKLLSVLVDSVTVHHFVFVLPVCHRQSVNVSTDFVTEHSRQLFQDAHLSWKHHTRERTYLQNGYARLGVWRIIAATTASV